ncbi:hypothetical protein BDR22DRAFT_891258 [Usnea florida]
MLYILEVLHIVFVILSYFFSFEKGSEMENYAPVTVDPPPPLHDASLGSSSANPAKSHQASLQTAQSYHETISQTHLPVTASKDEVGDDQNLSYLPSTSQRVALAALQGYDNGTIFAWLTGIRSFKFGGQKWFRLESLSTQQQEAISALKDCPDSLLTAWLEAARYDGNFTLPDNGYGSSHLPVQRAAAPSTRGTWQGSLNTSRSSSNSRGHSAIFYDRCTSPSTQHTSWSSGNFLDLSRDEASINENAATPPAIGAHTHWCSVCENPRKFATCDGWKRHMKEHETRYPCMPQGHEMHTVQGPMCVLCGLLNPGEQHYDSHKISSCSNKGLNARSYTRKGHLINHLKSHGIPDGSALAERWRNTETKKFFSCGFCIACFHTHTDQLNHIDNAHYKMHQHISEWNADRIIIGLLLQPGVQIAWRQILTLHDPCNEMGFHWNPIRAKSLQLRLEKSEEPSDILALAAFNESTHHWTQDSQVDSLPIAGFSHRGLNIPQHMPHHQASASLARMDVSLNQSLVYGNGSVNNALQPFHPTVRSDSVNQHSPGVPRTGYPAYQNNSSQVMMMTDRPQGCHSMQPEFPSSSSNFSPSSRALPHTPSNWSASNLSDAYGGQTMMSSSLMPDGHWQASLPHKSLADQSGNKHDNDPSRNNVITASQLTSSDPNKASSPLSQVTSCIGNNSACSLPRQPTKQPSRTKLKDHYDIDTEADMDLDLDFLQYVMREEETTRSEMRGR